MRIHLNVLVFMVVSVAALAQQHNVIDHSCLTNLSPSETEGRCIFVVYSSAQTDAQVNGAITGLRTELNAKIDASSADLKTLLAKDINNISANTMDALKAQLKEDLKKEILQELSAEIKAGKLQLPNAAVPQKTNVNPHK